MLMMRIRCCKFLGYGYYLALVRGGVSMGMLASNGVVDVGVVVVTRSRGRGEDVEHWGIWRVARVMTAGMVEVVIEFVEDGAHGRALT